MGNVKNLQAFGKLMGYCTGYGGKYNPGQQNLQVNALATLLNNAQQKIHEVQAARVALDQAKNERAEMHAAMKPLLSRVMNALKAMQVSKATLADGRSIVRSIYANRPLREPAAAPAETDAAGPKRIARGRDYATRLSNFAHFVRFVEEVPGYRPNEADLSVQALRDLLAAMRQAHAHVTASEVQLARSRQLRDVAMYRGTESLVPTALAVKRYVQSVFGNQSAEYRAVGALPFTNRP